MSEPLNTDNVTLCVVSKPLLTATFESSDEPRLLPDRASTPTMGSPLTSIFGFPHFFGWP